MITKEVYNHGKVNSTGRPVKTVDGINKIDYDAMIYKAMLIWPDNNKPARRKSFEHWTEKF